MGLGFSQLAEGTSWRERLYSRAPLILIIVILLILPLVMPGIYWQRVICITGIFALLAIAFDFLAGFAGMVSLGGALFTGVGGYIAGLCSHMLGFPVWLTIPVATLAGAVICTLLFLPCLPLRGIYFAIISLMYPLILPRIIEAFQLLGGTEGFTGLATFTNIWVDQYLVITAVILTLLGTRWLVNSDFGMVIRGIKDNEPGVKASGINTTLYKAVAVFIAALIGCFAGAYLVHLYGWMGTSLFGLDFSILPIAATVLGGGGILVGAVVGAFILTPLSEILRDFGTVRIVFYALILLLLIVLKPEGLMTWLLRKYRMLLRRREA
jgi:branched-chain amino acid transport system permease protein